MAIGSKPGHCSMALSAALVAAAIVGCAHTPSAHTRQLLHNDDRSLTQHAEHALGTADRALDNLDQYTHNKID